MADGSSSQRGRRLRTVAPKGPKAGPTVHAEPPALKSIFVRVDALEPRARLELQAGKGGTVLFTGESGEPVSAQLVRTWFPAGTWDVVIDSKDVIKDDFSCENPKDLDPKLVATVKEVGKTERLLTYRALRSDLPTIERMLVKASGKHARLVVTYAVGAAGNAKSRAERFELGDSNTKVLEDENVAELYLQFVEHFGGVKVDFSLARGGLTPDEIKKVEQGRPEIIEITNLFTTSFVEFTRAKSAAPKPPVGLGEFRAMEEAIFYQKRTKNDLATRNLLEIGIGALLDVSAEDGSRTLRPDIGVLRRVATSGGRLLLYDRHGYPVRGLNGYVDSELRTVDLEKIKRETGIPFLKLEIEDKGLYLFLRSIETNLGQPTREVEALAVSLYKHSVFITLEVKKRYNGEIGERLIQMALPVLGFFVAHAFAAWLAKRHPVGIVLMALLKAAGMVLGFDSIFLTSARLTEAGRHFTQMEQLHRESGDKTPKLTRLSEEHLRLGTAALIDAMVELVIAGIFLLGPLAGAKVGRSLLRGLRRARSQARTELTIQNGEATKIETINPDNQVEITTTKPPSADIVEGGLETPSKAAESGKPPPASKAVEEAAGPHVGEGQKGKHPEHVAVPIKRPRALDMSPADFANDKPAQLELFEAAKQALARQKDMAVRLMLEAGVTDADIVSVLKRDNFDEFVGGILAKAGGRKGYKTIGQMTDIIRGRINVPKPSDVKRVLQVLEKFPELNQSRVSKPQARAGVDGGYPRSHVDAIDPQTTLKHEWQIGTKATTRVYEKPGIDVGKLPIEAKNRNIHDIEYDIFKSIEEPGGSRPKAEQDALRALAIETGIPGFRQRVAELSARTGKEDIPVAELEAAIDALHREATTILKALVDKRGGDPDGINFVKQFLH